MIKEINLINWKSFNKLKFKFENINIIIGANASGKTNFLEALELLKKKASNSSLEDINEIRGGLEYFKNIQKKNFFISAVTDLKNFDNGIYSLKIDSGDSMSENLRVRNSEASFVEIKTDENPLETFRKMKKEYELEREKELAREKELKELISSMTIIDPIPREIRGKTKSTLDRELNKDCSNIIPYILNVKNKSQIEEKLLKYLQKLVETEIVKIEFKSLGDNSEYAQLYIEERTPNGDLQKLHSDIISDGTLRFISIIGALLTQKSKTILAIEEVDNGIAPAKTKLLLDIIDEISLEREVDVVVTTHNTSLMNYMSKNLFEYIFFAYRKKDGFTDIVRLRDIPGLPKLMSYGEVGELMEEDIIKEFIQKGEKDV
ncbi:AAA family ATPase [Cetobacterium sp.]|uniref:AAA family ATPase n=1 Tax=Cetobacterium sp. TaxID=2071632 RepID=UPI003F3E0A40